MNMNIEQEGRELGLESHFSHFQTKRNCVSPSIYSDSCEKLCGCIWFFVDNPFKNLYKSK